MTIQQEDNKEKGRFFIKQGEEQLAEMTYVYPNSNQINIEHTEVDVSLKGQGVGYKLVEAAVGFARKNDLKILPLCSYVDAVFKKKSDEYADVKAQ